MSSIIDFLKSVSLGELGDFATFGLFVFTLWQYKRISKAQYEQVEKDQAKNISAWIGPINDRCMATFITLNRSESPVYEVIVSLVAVQGAAFSDGLETPYEYRGFLSVLPPGEQSVGSVMADGGMGLHFGVEIAFTDSSGVSWVRKSDGSLNKINTRAVEYYGLSRPLTWEYPVSISS